MSMRIVRSRLVHDGIPVSPGIVIGRAYMVDRRKVKPPERLIDTDMVDEEIERFHAAIEEGKKQLRSVKSHYEKNNLGDMGYLVDVHLLMLEDQMIVRETEQLVRDSLHSADWALWQVIQKLKAVFEGMDDEYFRDRQNDIEHLGERILRNLVGLRLKRIDEVKEDVVIVAHDLSPMDTAQMDVHLVKGFVTDLGGRTSHTAILARSLGIPAVVGLESITDEANGGDIIVIDGIAGRVILNPTDKELAHYRKRKERYAKYLVELEDFASLPAVTKDDREVKVRANIELLDELELIGKYGGEGIGLYRTEFLYINRDHLPTEQEHYETYKKVARAVHPDPVTIRTLDLGGDKVAHTVPLEDEINPALGLRSIRLCLQETEIFLEQLRGILRASAEGNVRLMFPMVSGVGELDQALALLDRAREQLRERGVAFDEEMEVGVMVEVPSAAVMADTLAAKVNFLSIGTNDLIQYALAIDRVNEHVAYLYEPLHPAVLRLIRMTVDAAKRSGVRVAVCGEMAGDELYTLVLIGLRVDELSMHAASIPSIKRVINHASQREAQQLAIEVLGMSTAAEVHEYVENYARRRYPRLLDPLGDASTKKH